MSRAFDVVVVGAGPAGAVAALRAADLGARTALVSRGAFGGMAANDGPVPVRTLAHAARLMREARQLGRYGLTGIDPVLDYRLLRVRVEEVVEEVRRQSALRGQLESLGVRILEHEGSARFRGEHVLETATGTVLEGRSVILCTGGVSRSLRVPGAELTATHSDAWSLTSVPKSMLVIGGGATGVQVASIFGAFGSRVQLFQAGSRILSTEDEHVSREVADTFRESGIAVHEGFGNIERFDAIPGGIRMTFSKDGTSGSAEAALAVLAVGWVANTLDLHLDAAGVETDERGFLRVDEHLRTSAPHVFAAGDVTGDMMLVPQALQAGFVAGTNAVLGPSITRLASVSPIGSFTEPEYAQVGMTEAAARRAHDVVVAVQRFDATTRPIIDGRTRGFCKLIVDRSSGEILGCHLVGDRAVDIVQLTAVAMAARMDVRTLAHVPLSFPTYAGVLGRAAASAARQLSRSGDAAEASGPPWENG